MKRPFTVLLADDDKVQMLMLSAQLRAWGYQTATAYDATTAFMVAIRSPLDAIVLDIQMPGGTGKGVLGRLKSSTKTMQIPVIVLSGSIDPKAADEVRALGAVDYLTKPVDVELLHAALKRAMGISDEPSPVA